MDLATLINKISRLRVHTIRGVPAPHKAILLTSVLQLIDEEEIFENKIFITPELVARFRKNWHELVTDNRFTPNFALPFYHLQSSGFWFLRTLPGREILLTTSASIRSFISLKNTVSYACFESSVYELISDKFNRTLIIQNLLNTYLNGGKITGNGYDMIHAIEEKILHEPAELYRKETKVSDEEEIFVRGGVFKKVIPKIYNYTCCISGTKIIATRDVQMVDACHIVPFSESYDDTIKNGISLSPNLHRAFDRFLITINEKYEVVVSDFFTESGQHTLRSFHGVKIRLPLEREYHPSLDNLHWHTEKFRLANR